jgi:hypothetical protein
MATLPQSNISGPAVHLRQTISVSAVQAWYLYTPQVARKHQHRTTKSTETRNGVEGTQPAKVSLSKFAVCASSHGVSIVPRLTRSVPVITLISCCSPQSHLACVLCLILVKLCVPELQAMYYMRACLDEDDNTRVPRGRAPAPTPGPDDM